MSFTAATFLRGHRDEIIRAWEAAAPNAGGVSLEGSELRDHLPTLLDDLADWLDEGEAAGSTRLRAAAGEHASARLRSDYDLPQLIREFRVLRETTLRLLLEAEAEEQERAGTGGRKPERVVELARLNAGLDAAIAEIVERFVAERDREVAASRRSEHNSAQRYRALLESIEEGFCIVEMLFEGERPVDYRFVEVNHAFERQTGIVNAVGRRMREIAPGHEEHWFRIFGGVARSGEAVRFQNAARALGRIYDVYAFRIGDPGEQRVAVLFDDITARQVAEDALRRSEERLRTVVEHSRDGINMLDLATGRYVLVSPAQVAITGFTAEDLNGMSAEAALERVHPDDRAVAVRQQQALAEGDERESIVEYRWKVKSGEYRWFSDSRALVCDEEGRPIALVGVSRDITERKSAEEDLRESDRRKTEFLAVLSHELRNPLAPIRNSIYLLERAGQGSAQAARAKEVLRRQTEHLTRLVDDLLDVTRISSGKIRLEWSRVDLREVVRRTTDDVRSMFDHASVELRVEHASGPAWVDGDSARLTQVLGNLLQNALKFTGEGGTVSVEVATPGDAVTFAVRDTGAGMEPEEVERMFEPFAQGAQGMARTRGGLGLGLALVKGIVELHGGKVRASSAGPGRGAEFEVTLPRAAPERSRPGRAAVAHDGDGRLVLIVEDNDDAGRTLADVLELAGHRVRVARDGRSGLALARELEPDVVLCDIGLPDIDGYEFARAARRDPALDRTRLVALTGYAQPEDRERAHEAGFDAHLAKPPAFDALQALLGDEARHG